MRVYRYKIRIHGTAFMVEYPGPDGLRNAEDVPWTDQQGFRRGGGVVYRGQPFRDNYFHAAFSLPSEIPLYNPFIGGTEFSFLGTAVVGYDLSFQLNGPASIFHVGLFDGTNRFHSELRRPALDIRSGGPRPASRHLINTSLGMSVGVNFGEGDSSVIFIAASIDLETIFWEPTDPRP